MKSFLRGLATTVLIVDALAVVVGLLALFAGVLWVLTEVCKKLEDISQVLDEDICEGREAVRDSVVDFGVGRARAPVAPSTNNP